jgi:mannose-6-phosphate isomerase-like protein (cupin superfamily)
MRGSDDDGAGLHGALVPPGVEHGFRIDGAEPVRILNIHAPAGFDRRIGLQD